MKTSREPKVESRELGGVRPSSGAATLVTQIGSIIRARILTAGSLWSRTSTLQQSCLRPSTLDPRLKGFTLIEIMIVVAIIGLIMAMGLPSLYQASKKEGMRRAITDLRDVCSNARAQAIFTGQPSSVRFYPMERRFFVVSGGGGAPPVDPVTGEPRTSANPGSAPNSETKGIFPDDLTLEMLEVNMIPYTQSEGFVDVRFSERGTSDELTVILRDTENKYRKLVLEPTTGLLLIGDPKDDLTR